MPIGLSGDEVRAIFILIRKPVARVVIIIIYCRGLRVLEAARLRVEDIDSKQRLLLVRNGKGQRSLSVSF